MPDLRFQVADAVAPPNAAFPQLVLRVRVVNAGPEEVHSVALRVQVQVEPVRRSYTAAEQEKLTDLFGEPERWSRTLHSLLWTNANLNVAGFSGSTIVEVPLPCTFDFNVAMTKYIYGLENGELPISLLFSGTVFYAAEAGLRVAQIPWDREASFRMPVQLWKQLMDLYYPGSAWLCLRRDAFENLCDFRRRYGLATWEDTIERVLEMAAEVKS